MTVLLAYQPEFTLGSAHMKPGTCEVAHSNGVEVLEPLVMQVLVVLAQAEGRVLTRHDLIEACWGGRSVSEDAINRVISRIRRLGATTRAFDLETIRKVGYRLTPLEAATTGERLIAAPAPAPDMSGPPSITGSDRRPFRMGRAALVLGLGLATLSALGLVWAGGNSAPPPAASRPAASAPSAPDIIAALAGRWGAPGCEVVYAYAVTDGRVVATAPGYRSEGRIVAVENGAILSEALSPVADRGKLVEIRAEGDQLVLQDRTTNLRIVLERCP